MKYPKKLVWKRKTGECVVPGYGTIILFQRSNDSIYATYYPDAEALKLPFNQHLLEMRVPCESITDSYFRITDVKRDAQNHYQRFLDALNGVVQED